MIMEWALPADGVPRKEMCRFMIYGIVHALHEDNPAPEYMGKYELEFLNR